MSAAYSCRTKNLVLDAGSRAIHRWRGVGSNFWFRARSEYGRGWRCGFTWAYSAPARFDLGVEH
jgi:hypothetical protein